MDTPESMYPMVGMLVKRVLEFEATRSGTPEEALFLAATSFWMASSQMLGMDALEAIRETARSIGVKDTEQYINRARRAAVYEQEPERKLHMTYQGYFLTMVRRNNRLSPGRRWVLRHRKVLFDSIGATDHACETCGWVLPWHADSPDRCINVDHINGVKGDDRLENLRALCHWCNKYRNWAEVDAPERWQATIDKLRAVPPWDRPPFTRGST